MAFRLLFFKEQPGYFFFATFYFMVSWEFLFSSWRTVLLIPGPDLIGETQALQRLPFPATGPS